MDNDIKKIGVIVEINYPHCLVWIDKDRMFRKYKLSELVKDNPNQWINAYAILMPNNTVVPEPYFSYEIISNKYDDKKEKYWIEIEKCSLGWFWQIKCCNGRVKARSRLYKIHSLCFNDANSFSEYMGMDIR